MAVKPGFPPAGPPVEPAATRWRIRVEDALILLAIPVLWLTVLRMTGAAVLAVQVAVLVILAAILVARVRRLWAARRKAEDEARKL